jgi:FCP1-like phosphatase family protein
MSSSPVVKKRRRLTKRQPSDGAPQTNSTKFESCPHPAVVSGYICAVCGKNLMQDKIKLQRVTISGSAGGMAVNETEASSLASSTMRRLHAQRKLQLVLDIDQTLLECSPRPPPYELASIVPISLYNGQVPHWLKLRPGVREFLSEASKMYEMTLYTNGIREYLIQVAKALDPTRQLFGDRLVSTPDDNPDLQKDGGIKDLTRLFPGSIEMCLILDDRDDIWKGIQKEHLLIVRPYSYFRFTAEGQPCFPPGEDRCVQLETHLKLLRRIYRDYYQPSSASAPSSSSSSYLSSSLSSSSSSSSSSSHCTPPLL